MRPDPHFLTALGRTQLRIRHAVASTGTGERRSRAKGAGMEFADFREYVAGDDTRHLDARMFARHGDFFVREFEVHKQLPVTIVIDASRSMQFGAPDKLGMARWLANVLGYLALVGGDRVQVAFWNGRVTVFSPAFTGAGRSQRLFEWIERQEPEGELGFEQALTDVAPKVAASGLAILISDWWVEDAAAILRPVAARRAEIWALQVLTPEEIDPEAGRTGAARLMDAESGVEFELDLDPATLNQYREALAIWRDGFTAELLDLGGVFFSLSTDRDPEHFVMNDLRLAGLVGV